MKKMELQKCVLGSVFTNCYFIKNKETKEILIVDPADNPERIREKIRQMGGSVVGCLLTHGHFDHIMAVNELKESCGMKIYACSKEQELLLDAEANLSGYYGKRCSVKADVLLEDGQELTLAGFSVRVLHTPGHTTGSCCYYFPEEGVLISGDTLFYGSVGRTDFPGGSMSQIVDSLHRLLLLPEETEVFPGHDASTTIGYEKRYNPFA